ncbi:AP-4 complex subunit sigma [Camellia lanceoleosa]|uniref:AP-4 complex subunit sigma n=1 Tax=Camellia lanceoleosa TaxID=1840588 RepID=A0ACC0FKX7_9ERIC|nr:AP-4 complex subunit sigma [Camellia lanceoleosa]
MCWWGSEKKMGIRFILMVNKQGQTRLAQYYDYLTIDERRALEGEIVKNASLLRTTVKERLFRKINFRIQRSLGKCINIEMLETDQVGCGTMNELAILEFIHLLVETMDRHFGNVCELDIMFHLEKAHFMLEEMVMNGCIVETSKANILSPIQLIDKAS